MAHEFQPGLVPKLAKKARLRFDRHSGTHMLVYPERGLALNDSAARILKLIDGERSVGDIAQAIHAELKLEARQLDDVIHDILELVEDLRKKGLVET